ncbi:hypothetical protein A2311_04695 [candidate division WOR-1 bacterium RIFOXYB2_FULL_48_7]|uniref:PSP1 C-terminal domain-containing protein n=1 Tax=candidate division WOR-1 bacterium RIFOXYB2_FULL_48_7 TaxID=1802583 RepID=A0A1F4TS30_UNCSA|nr:MAG: hypothetical protein A2311_04695 [candidate division WOR-1 bacterium RIFOXYB2_FULL_48_7]
MNLGIKIRKFDRVCPITGYKEESIKVGSPVIVQTDRGMEFGEIVAFSLGVPRNKSRDVHLKKVVRYATAEDLQKEQELTAKEEASVLQAADKVKEHELPIKIIAVEFVFDQSKAMVYYRLKENEKAPNLRDFARDLSTTFATRVETKQLSPRDEARLFGGTGPCGRPICCSVWLDKPKHVTVKMAKQQGIAISPTKTSGVCGRLMCCLEYEHENK